MVGAAVRLAPPGPCLAVAEGLETAASFGELEGVATWATLGSANLAAFTPPACVRHLIIVASGDPGATAAASFLAQRMRARCDVTILSTPDGTKQTAPATKRPQRRSRFWSPDDFHAASGEWV
jgi:hypothetical protein